ncbi:hypothetical protein [Cecembia calidifontis]|jgi:hypothetical protein|uniref:Uncharacterized protein n=1 Tax=Cecembia calidifontis TaxID=1187080 RepID=A0A4Q7P5H4_9BACT|nr:hypothetical protein [Cecembia calidifontis]RZS95175.1 hypothetical protein BC751_0691 [Cecembia calidifontis]
MKNKKPKEKAQDFAEEWDFSEGFGGIPQDVDLTKNIGCASGGNKKKKSSVPENQKGTKE